MKKFYKYSFLFVLILSSCKNKNELDEISTKDISFLFEKIFYKNIQDDDYSNYVKDLNKQLKETKKYDSSILIEEKLYNGIDYYFKKHDFENNRTPDKADVSICYKSDSLTLINNQLYNKETFNKIIINLFKSKKDEFYVEFSINTDNTLSVNEWKKCINFLKYTLKHCSDAQVKNKSRKPFRMLFIFKSDCFLNSGPPNPM